MCLSGSNPPGAPSASANSLTSSTSSRSALPPATQVPGPEAEGVEREVKWGHNIPASTEQAREELTYVSRGSDGSCGVEPLGLVLLCDPSTGLSWCLLPCHPHSD